jgi:hypothetical protein
MLKPKGQETISLEVYQKLSVLSNALDSAVYSCYTVKRKGYTMAMQEYREERDQVARWLEDNTQGYRSQRFLSRLSGVGYMAIGRFLQDGKITLENLLALGKAIKADWVFSTKEDQQ